VRGPLLILLGVVAALVLLSSVYVIDQTEQAIVVQLGSPVGGAITEPGLHFKIPLLQEVKRFDKRWLEFSGDANEIPTKDKKYIWVETYARWRIVDPLRFYQAVSDERGGQSRLDDIIDGKTRDEVAKHNLIEIVRTSNREFQVTEELEGIGAAEAMAPVSTGRGKIAETILGQSAIITPSELGIELKDVRFRRLNYVESVQRKVFERMISERQRIAERSRSEGQGRAAEIRGEKERDILKVTSEAYRQAEQLKGEADGKATAIYAQAYGRDSDFYQFARTMETLKKGLDEETWLILSTDSELLKYLKGPSGR
jgi:modulator of FtsH protease HflC